MNRGLETAGLREIYILRHLTEDELANIKTIHVYGSGRSADSGLSALYITQTDEVFLVGFDSLVGKSSTKVPDGCLGVLRGSVKVQELSGKSVQKIVVGAEFGAALTSSNELYMWGSDLGGSLSRLVVRQHIAGATCPKCEYNRISGRPILVGSGIWSNCVRCGKYYNEVSTIPHPADWKGQITSCLGYPASVTQPKIPSTLLCVKCKAIKNSATRLVSNFYIVVCSACYSPGEDIHMLPPQTSPTPHKVQTTFEIGDIAAGMNCLLIRTPSQLIIWGDLNGVRYNQDVLNSYNVKFTKVACGSSHIAAITDKGHLYTCGVGSEGQLGYAWSNGDGCIELKHVALKEPALDVACGVSSTLCLLQNGTRVVYGNVTKIVQLGSMFLDLYDRAVIVTPSAVVNSFGNILDLSLKHQLQPRGKRLPVLTGDLADEFIILHGSKFENTTSPISESCASNQSDYELRNDQHSPKSQCQDSESQTEPEVHDLSSLTKSDRNASVAHQSSNSAHLYGQLLFSDLTLKLADGDFPVHRVVLYTTSAYFSQLFADSNPPDVLDMSSYNASAYRGLLKYFYGVPLGPMTCEDLFDLNVIANSYKENWISSDVISKLKSSIDADNVLSLHDRAKAANDSVLLKECQNFMDAPEFKQSLFDRLAQKNMMAELLRLSLSSEP